MSALQVVVESSGTIYRHVVADWVELEGWINRDARAQKVALEPSALVSGQLHAKMNSPSDCALIEGKVLEAVVKRGNSLTERLARVN